MTKMKWAIIASLIIMLLALPLLGACGEKAATTGGTLRIIQGAEVMSLGYPPDMGGPEDYYQRQISIEQLVRLNDKGEIVPFLAESYTEDPENLTVTFKLREGVKFHDGSILDASVCKWNLEQLSTGTTTGMDFWRVDSINVVDDYTVQIKFSAWDSVFMRNMAWDSSMISKASFEKNGKDWAINNPVGTGPFKLVSWQRDVSKVYERFDDYWQEGKPYLDRIIVNIIADPMVQVASFLAGENDMISVLSPVDAVNLESEPDVVIAVASLCGGTTQEIVGDSANPNSPFSNIKVREALNYAIDRDALAENIYKGYASPVSQLGISSLWSYNQNIQIPSFDPDKARELLDDAGYGDGFDTTITFRNDKIFRDLYTAIQGYLEGVGITVNLQPVEVGRFFDITFNTGWPEGTLMQEPPSYDPELGSLWSMNYGAPMPISTLVAAPQELLDVLNTYYSASDFETKQSLSWQIQDMIYNKYFLHTAILSDKALAAKYSYIHDEYTCDWDFYPYTFADVWIEE